MIVAAGRIGTGKAWLFEGADGSVRGAMHDFERLIRAVPDFPKPGILFRDITPVLEDARAFHQVIDLFTQHYRNRGVTKVAGIESRGFILGAPLALALGAGFVVLRKPGKLPRPTTSASYALEYGEATLHLHTDAVGPGDVVVVIDDLVATGGTLAAAVSLITGAGATLLETAALIELKFLAGREKLPAGVALHTLVTY